MPPARTSRESVAHRAATDPHERAAVTTAAAPAGRAAGATLVLLTLASGQFLMTLDSSVMNVSIATVAEDVGTTVTGIQRRSPRTRSSWRR